MKRSIALVLPAFNLADTVETSLINVKKGIELFPQHDFLLFPTDDGSTDKTFEAVNDLCKKHNLPAKSHKNKENLGLVQTLKQSYRRVLETDSDAIIRTDLDSDFDQSIVIRKLILFAEENNPIAVGVRWREIKEEENPYEFERRNDIIRIMNQELELSDLDPASVGSQLYQNEFIANILRQDIVKDYDRKWGLDFLIPVVARSLKYEVPVTKIEKGKYDPKRRPQDKVKAQYDAYIETIAKLTSKKPKDLSSLYG